MKNKFYLILIFILFNLLITSRVLAVNLTLESPQSSLGLNQQFYVDLRLDPQGQEINLIKGQVSFNDEFISFIRIENNKSIVSLWPEEPTVVKNAINFAGAIPNGFAGLIDPFNPSFKSSDLILRLVFETKKVGHIDFSTTPFYLNLNDGLGTEIKALPAYLSFDISNFINKQIYELVGEGSPELEAYITRDPNIYNNKYILVFRAYDKQVGIRSVILKEGWHSWQKVSSPYLLKNQARHNDINLQATNNAGVSIVMKIDKLPYNWLWLVIILILFILILILRKRLVQSKNWPKNNLNT